MTDAAEAAARPAGDIAAVAIYPKPLLAWYTVGLLCLLFWLALVDRYIISLMIDPIRADFGISDFQVSLLQGIAFTVAYGLIGLPMGWAIDRFARRWVVTFGIMIWSVATSASGLAQNFGQLFAARMAVGGGEAVLNPSAYSILADTFPKARLGLAMSVYAIGAVLGSGFAYSVGGIMIEYVTVHDLTTVPFVGTIRPWQVVLLGLGILGLPVSLMMFTVPEPKRIGAAPQADAGKAVLKDVIDFLRRHGRWAAGHHVGFSFITIVAGGLTLWSPVYLTRTFGWSIGEVGLALGLTIIPGGIIGAFVSGNAMDWLWRRGHQDAHMRWYFYVVLGLIPLGLVMTLAHNPYVFLAGKFVYHVFAASYSSAGGASIAVVAPNELRGRISAFYMLIQNIIGNTMSAIIVAAYTDFLFRDDALVGYSIAMTFVTALPISAAFLYLGMKPMRDAVAAQMESDSAVAPAG